MCIIIDTNTLSAVFNPNSQNHNDFEPVLKWIIFGNGKLVYGGSKYTSELRRTNKYLKIFVELSKKRKVIKVDDSHVDSLEVEISNIINDSKFNDPHIPAIVIIAKCRLICSCDSSAYKYFKRKDIYPQGFGVPKIYCKAGNSDLLCNKDIVGSCAQTIRLQRAEAEAFVESL